MLPSKFFKNKKILIIGGTGSWGSELVRQLATKYNPSEIRIFSRGEHKQVEMRRKYAINKNIRFIIGDVRDFQSVDLAAKDVDIIFNLAALKHVPVCEENVWEAVQTNIHGPHNIVQAALKNNVETAVQISTDKAVDPYNLYGYTKGVAERIFTSANFSPGKSAKTKFVCIRAGNVLSTAGSVVPLFKYLIKNHNKITVTNKNMSRYIMRLEHAMQLVIKATTESIGGEIFVMKMPGIKILDLAIVMKNELGDKKTRIEEIGIRPGEKLYELLVSKNEAPRTYEDGKYYVILPDVYPDRAIWKKYKRLKKIKIDEYNSLNTYQFDQRKILQILKEDGWLKKDREEQWSSILSPY